MRLRKLWSVALGLAIVLGAPAAVHAGIFYSTLVNGAVNTYEDQDRESIVDIDDDGALSEGDVLFGFVRIDDRSAPLPGSPIPDDDLYAVFSFEVATIASATVGPIVIYSITFAATTNATAVALGLDLASLTGGLPALEPGSATAAVYEDVGINLITTSPGDFNGDGAFNMFDFTDRIALGATSTLDLVIGFGGGPTEADDHWVSTFVVPAAGDPIASLSLLSGLTLAGGSIGTNSFHAGQSILFHSSSFFLELVPDLADGPPGTLHELTVQNGNVSGAADLTYPNPFAPPATANPFFFTIVSGADTFDVFGVSTNADFNVYPVPEPSTLTLLALGGVGLVAARRSRKSKAK